jgi:23S rRNA (adenine2503-C2)-methyltransferase
VPPIALQGVLPDELARACSIDAPSARRIVSYVHREGALPGRAPATIRRRALDAVRAYGFVPRLTVLERRASALDPFVKFAFRLPDGASVEAVRIPLEHPARYSVCVSSQVGCALACSFCATGLMGLRRNLEVWEMIEQVREVRADLAVTAEENGKPRGRVHGVLFQGMGEPLANVERVIGAIRILSDPSALAIDMRNITVSTVGLPTAIRRLASEVPAVRVALSIGSVRPGRRHSLMPIDDVHPLDEVLEAVRDHARATRHSPMWSYTLLAGVNDSDEDAHALAEQAIRFADQTGVRPRLSLIPYNTVEGAPFARSEDDRLASFSRILNTAGVGSIVRYSGGSDVGAACGQLSRPGKARGGAELDD